MDQKQALKKAKRLMSRHPDHVPIIIIKHNIKLETVKFLPNKTSTLAELIMHIRGYTSLKPSEGLLVFIGSVMPPLTAQIGNLYDEYASPNGYLHISISKENTFG